MAKQGKCPQCRIRFFWETEILLKLVNCSKCGGELKRTSYLCNFVANHYMIKLDQMANCIHYKIKVFYSNMYIGGTLNTNRRINNF